MNIKKIFFFLLVVCFPALLFSMDKFNRLNEDVGLSSRRCFAICQDKDGLIWIANKLSIDRFDGYQVIRYELKSPEHQMPDNIGFNFVTLAPDSTVWAFTQSGAIYSYDKYSDSFTFVYSIRSFYNSYNIILNNVFFDNNNTLLLATSKGVLKLDLSKKVASDCHIVENTEVYHIIKEDDMYYVASKNGLYVALCPENKPAKVVRHLMQGKLLNRLYYDSKYQQFWIGTFSDGIYLYSKRGESRLQHIIPQITKPIRDIITYNDTEVAVGIDGEGVLLINRQTLQIEHIFAQVENQPNSISGNSVWDLLLDRQKILWIATYHEGVSFLDHSNLNFRSFTHERGNINSIAANYINAVLEDKDGDLWFGTNNGLSLFRRKTLSWTHYFQGKSNSSEKNVILSLCEGKDEKIWAGGYAFGVAEIDKRRGTIARYHVDSPKKITGTECVYAIYKDEFSDEIWFGGIYGQLSCYNPKTGTTRMYNEESLRCFSSYDDSNILLGLYRGLYLMNKQTGKKKETKLNATINTILKDGDKSYWIGTLMNGLYHYDMKTDSLRRYTKTDGLSSNHIYGIEKDEEGFLWISTEEGLNKFSPQSGTFFAYDKQDGLISNQFIPGAGTRCATSEIIFGSADGAVIFSPSEIKKLKIKDNYKLMFTGFYLFGNPVNAGGKGSPLKVPINETKKITLPYNKNYFSIAFTLPSYQLSDKTRYSYFLKGYDLDWSKLTTDNMITYSKIQPGKYLFKLRVYIDRQLQEERQIEIVVNQPWWNSVWAWIVYTLLILSGIYYFYRYYSERTRKKQTEEKMEFFINTAHDILTPLSLIEAPLKDISFVTTLSEEAKYLLSLALNNTRKLNSFVHQLIDFQKISLNTSQLQVRKNNLQSYFTKKANDYHLIASQKFIVLDMHLPQIDKEVFFDAEKVNKILDNLLSNAIKYTPYGGKIDIFVSLLENEWSFKVKDTGIGISKKNQNFIFKYIFREDNDVNNQNVGSGLGLKMVHALVRIHQGKITFNSNKNEGTEFVITLPYVYDEKYIDKSSPVENKIDFIRQDETEDTRLFVVVSDKEMANYLSNTLSREYAVDSFDMGAAAFSQVTRLQPRLILVDLQLTDMDGYSFCQRIKENADTSHISTVLITDYSDKETIKKILASGATDFIVKPFESEFVSLKIANLMNLQQVWQNKALSEIKKNNITAINNDRDQEFMEHLIQFVEQNLDNPELNISMLCEELALSRTLLYNKVTQLTGNSPNEFIRVMRLKNAANLLISGKYTIAEISTMVGIDNPKYFSRIFKDYYKVSPKNYLRKG